MVNLEDAPNLAQRRAHRLRPLAVAALQDLHPLDVAADLDEVAHRVLPPRGRVRLGGGAVDGGRDCARGHPSEEIGGGGGWAGRHGAGDFGQDGGVERPSGGRNFIRTPINNVSNIL